MDWNEVKAADLFVVLSSFLPKGGQILSTSIYPSEFGLQRMEEEAIRGPAALFNGEEENKDKDSEDDDDEMDNEKLRAYEKSRLRYYYYAVVVCDSVATADYLYKSCDGVEFERSSNVLDLTFIPDEMEFKHPPRDQATEIPILANALGGILVGLVTSYAGGVRKLQDVETSTGKSEVKFQVSRDTLGAMLRSMAYIGEQLSNKCEPQSPYPDQSRKRRK